MMNRCRFLSVAAVCAHAPAIVRWLKISLTGVVCRCGFADQLFNVMMASTPADIFFFEFSCYCDKSLALGNLDIAGNGTKYKTANSGYGWVFWHRIEFF